jgi:catechol 2,3-dioxygenase-like lactoylglutathione lyase family enzyme
MFFGVSHIVVPVTDLEDSIRIWRDVIGFTESRRGEEYADMDTGNVSIRLIKVPAIESRVALRLNVYDVAAAYQQLLAGGTSSRYAPTHTPDLEEMACVTDPDGHSIVLWRPLTEDEWKFVPELPKKGEWYPDAEELVQRLLKHVPALFRMLARRKVTRVVEELAKADNSPVTREHVIKGYITSSAKVTRSRLIAPLHAEGINPDDYQEEFDYE